VHCVIAQYGQIDPERIVLDNPILECRAKAGSRGGTGRVMFFFKISLEIFPAELERNFEALNGRVAHDLVLG
jgi:hypothetical protein